ncbi:MAG: serine hydrolase domain-containing protein [Gemmatimonadaceae bacterium]
MKRHFPLLFGIVAMVVHDAPVSAQSTRPAHGSLERIARVEAGLRFPRTIKGRKAVKMRLDDRMRHLKVPGVSIAVVDSFRIAWARGYGVREMGGAGPVTTETLFQAASVSKPVAALAALRLVQKGKLDLDEDVNLKLTSWKVPVNAFTVAQPVTLRRLLSHGAGLTVHGFMGYASKMPVPTVLQVLAGQSPANSAAIRVDTVPGSKWRYSGGGYTVMQQLLVDVTRRSFPDVMRTEVLEPLGMTRSTYEQPLPQALIGTAASGHRSDGTVVQGKWHTYPEMAAAGLWTTPSDLARYAIEVQLSAAGRSNRVVSRPTTIQMLTAQTGTWGLGPGLTGEGSNASFSHGGANEGFRVFFTAFNERGQGAVVMTNSDAGSPLLSEIVRAIAEEYDWPTPRTVEKTVADVSPEKLTPLAGRYVLEEAPNIFIAITVEGERVFADVIGQVKTEIYPESETTYFSVDQDFDFVFSLGDGGKITGFVVSTESGAYKAKRVE